MNDRIGCVLDCALAGCNAQQVPPKPASATPPITEQSPPVAVAQANNEVASIQPADVENRGDVANWIQQLASTNEAPEATWRTVSFPEGYSIQAQRNVEAARQHLYDHFEEALPQLIAALDDKRYSLTINWASGDAYYNRNVGEVCKDIITSQLEVYRDKMQFGSPKSWADFNYPVSKEWWKDRRGKSHRELQIEAIEWAIERINEKWPSTNIRPDIVPLPELRDQLSKSDKPLPGRRMSRIQFKTPVPN